MTDPLAAPTDDTLLVVVGPTASGKTELALHLCEQHGGELVSADSVQVYRHFELGTGKPTPEERARATHHLVDIVDPLEEMDAARFVELADAAIEDIRRRGRRPIVCGGTFLWVKALLRGLAPMPPADAAIRAEHTAFVAAEGRPALHARLAEVDPDAAARLAPNDFVRVSRALEVFAITGRTQTALHAEHQFLPRRYAARLLGVERTRDELDERIRLRVQRWLEAGWVEQVSRLRDRGFGSARAMDAVGFRQVVAHLDGQLPWDALEDAIVRATRTFTRRQRTWLRDEDVTYVPLPRA